MTGSVMQALRINPIALSLILSLQIPLFARPLRSNPFLRDSLRFCAPIVFQLSQTRQT